MPADRVLATYLDDDDLPTSFAEPEAREAVDLVGAIRSPAGELRLFPFGDRQGVERCLAVGPALAELMPRRLGRTRLDLATQATFPSGGFVIDEAARRVEFWCASAMPGLRRSIDNRWPGWTIRWHRDDYATCAAPLVDALRLPPVEVAALRARIRDALLAPPGRDGAQLMLGLISHLGGERDVQANPSALRDAHVELTLEQRRELLDRAAVED